MDILDEGAGTDTFKMLNDLERIETGLSKLRGTKFRLDKEILDAELMPKLMAADKKRHIAAQESVRLLKEKKFALEQFELANQNLTGTDAEKHKLEVERREKEIALLEKKANTAKKDASDVGRIMESVTQSMETGLASAFDGIIQGTMSVKQAFTQMGISILQVLSRLIAEMIAVKILQSIIGYSIQAPDIDTSDLNIPDPTANFDIPMNMPSSMPSNFDIPVYEVGSPPGYSKGGIASGPASGYPAVLHGTEAVVPLPGGRSIPVEMKGSSAHNENNITINISQSGEVQQEDGETTKEAKAMARAVKEAIKKEIQNQKRNGGSLSPFGAA